MLYVSDISRIKDNLLGITDTQDNVTEYVSISDVANSGLDIKGYSKTDIFTAIPLVNLGSEFQEDDVVYLGDWIAPPISKIICRLYPVTVKPNPRAQNYTTDVKVRDYLLVLFYKYNNKLVNSVCRLNLDSNIIKKYAKANHIDFKDNLVSIECQTFKILDNYPTVKIPVLDIIKKYFSNNAMVDINITVLDDTEEYLNSVLETETVTKGSRVRLKVLNATGGDSSACVSVKPDYISNYASWWYADWTLLSNFRYFSKSQQNYNSCMMELINKLSNFSKIISGGTLNIEQIEDAGDYIDVKLNRTCLYENLDTYSLKSFGYWENSKECTNSILEQLKVYFPHKIAYIEDICKRYDCKCFVYFTIDGTYLVRESAIEAVRQGNNKALNSLKAKTKIISPHMRVTGITKDCITVALYSDSKSDMTTFDIAGLLKSYIGNFKKVRIEGANLLMNSKANVILPAGVTIEINLPWTVKLSEAYFRITSTELSEVFDTISKLPINCLWHVTLNDDLNLKFIYKVLSSTFNISVKQYTQILVDYAKYMDSLDVATQEKFIKCAHRESLRLIKRKMKVTVNSRISKEIVDTLVTSGVLDRPCDLNYVFDKLLTPSTASSTTLHNKINAVLNCIYNLVTDNLPVPQLLIQMAKLYCKVLRSVEVATDRLIRDCRYNLTTNFDSGYMYYSEDIKNLSELDDSKWKLKW